MTDLFMHPVPKGRPRVVNGKAYTPKETKRAERELRDLWAVQNKVDPDFNGYVSITVDVHTPGGRGDLDNYVKLVLDALNGVAWKDDRSVVEIRARRFFDNPEGYRIEVTYL